MALLDAPRDLAQHGVGAAAARGAAHERDHAEAARERAAVLDLHEGADAVEPRVGLDAADRADVAGDERGRLLGAAGDDGDVRGQAASAPGVEVRGAAGQVDAAVGARGARGRLAALRDRLVRDAAAVDHRDVGGRRCGLDVTVGEQALADLVGVDVRDLAAEEFDAEAHCSRDRTARSVARRGQRLAAEHRRARGRLATHERAGGESERRCDTGVRREDARDGRAGGRAAGLGGRHPGQRLGSASRREHVERLEQRDVRRAEREPGDEEDGRELGRGCRRARPGRGAARRASAAAEVAVERRRSASRGCRTRAPPVTLPAAKRREERASERRVAPAGRRRPERRR